MTSKVRVSPSLLSADPLRLGEELKDIESCGADFHHVDVMDGHFVPNLTYGPPLVMALKKSCKIPLDVHIMVSNPDTVAIEYVKAGADILTFHIEAAKDPRAICEMIRKHGAKAGISLNPNTPPSTIHKVLDVIDVILVMSVFPGFGGQKFIEESTGRVAEIAATLKEKNLDKKVIIEIDGGINDKNVKKVVDAGVSMVVAGSFVYNATSRKDAINSLRV